MGSNQPGNGGLGSIAHGLMAA
ncbi:uncharacterized protein G2W53_005732 [Senna tora]|uniref:Uncharacterized protein n=1 Tax=Senna tora TaxID=362788 RepID=A0A834X3Z8_9FABA|nr:uncharacterized protein G2W53_005732 [Senna tora]